MLKQEDFNNGFCILMSEECAEGELNRFTFIKDSTSQTPGVESELVILAKAGTFTVGKYYNFAVTIEEAP